MRLLTALNSQLFLLAILPDFANAVRLIGGSRGSEGRLEVSHDGQWGTVCDDNFGVIDAMVVCRTLGYTESVPEVQTFGSGSGQIWLDEVRCSGSESDLFQCPHKQPTGSHDCSHSEDVGIDCQPPVKVRLVGGGRSSAGRVEVRIRGLWGTVCDDEFGTSDAKVVCRMLGYTSETPSVKSSPHYGRGSNPIWLDNVGCTGSEADILQCNLPQAIGSNNCGHSEDVGVDCQPSLVSSIIRLANVSRGSAGRVEVHANGQWGTVCDDDFGVEDARVACRMLGYTSELNTIYRGSAYYGQGTGPIWLDDLGCQGTESSLFSCSHNGVGNENCDHSEDVGVDCRPLRGPTEVSITGPPYHATNGSQSLSLLCKASSFTPSVFFKWSGVTCQTTITSADFSICVFTPRLVGDHGNNVSCTATNTYIATLSVSSVYSYTLKYPPTSAPVLNGPDTSGSLKVGSAVTLTCTITGGTPTVSSVSVVCTKGGRTMTFTSSQTRGGSSVSRTIAITDLRLEDDGTVCRCTGNWSTRPDLYTLSSSRTLRVFDPPTTAPVITGLSTVESLVAGSAINLTCTITGGTPPVSWVDIACTGQERTLTFTSFNIWGSSSTSRTISITNLQLEDDGTVCRCTGTWSTRPDLYTMSSSRTLRVFHDAAPRVTSLAINGAASSLTVTAGEKVPVTLNCTATGRPVPSFTMRRHGRHGIILPTYPSAPTQPISISTDSSMAAAGSTVVVGLDKRALQVELTRSPRCQDAAKYTCLVNNRAGVDTKSVVLFVNCPPSFAPDNEIQDPQHPLVIQAGDHAQTTTSAVRLMVYPIPTLKQVMFYYNTDHNTTVAQEVDREMFRLLCEPSEALYLQACTISYASEDVPQPGDYELTIGNLFGDLSLGLKLEVPKAAKGGNQNLPIYIGGGVGGAVVLLLVLGLLALIVGVRMHRAKQPLYDSTVPQHQVSPNPSYSDLCLASSSQAAQTTEARDNRTAEGDEVGAARYTGFPSAKKSPADDDDGIYENAAMETDEPEDSPDMNVGDFAAGTSAEQPLYDSTVPRHQVSPDASYSDLRLASSSQGAQTTEARDNRTAEGDEVGAARYTGFPSAKKSPADDDDAIYDNAAMETDEPEDSPYMNVGDVAAGTSGGSRTGAVTVRGDSVIYENTKFP